MKELNNIMDNSPLKIVREYYPYYQIIRFPNTALADLWCQVRDECYLYSYQYE